MGIKEVAEAAGVSITTVSHALNGKGRLPTETRERVKPSPSDSATSRTSTPATSPAVAAAPALAVSQVKDLAFQLGDFDYFGSLISYATTAAIDRGYALAVAPAADAEQTLHKISAEGAIVVDPVPNDPSVLYLRQTNTPLVTTGRTLDGG